MINIIEKPKKVRVALTMFYVVLALGIINGIFNVMPQISTLSATTSIGVTGVIIEVIVVALLTLAIIAFLIVMIGHRKNWARITFLILFLIGVLPSIPIYINSFTLNPLSGSVELIQAALEIIALVLLFQKESSSWFRGVSVSNPIQ
jgi:uncharacterized membrane protein